MTLNIKLYIGDIIDYLGLINSQSYPDYIFDNPEYLVTELEKLTLEALTRIGYTSTFVEPMVGERCALEADYLLRTRLGLL